MSPGFGISIGKENFVVQPSINESNMPNHAAHLSPSSHVPLADIPNSIVNHVKCEGTWKRLAGGGVISNVGISEAVGEKGSAGNITNQTELPKKGKVS